jgi:hypothetical protein
MSVWDSPLFQAFRREAAQRERVILLPDHVAPALAGTDPIQAGKGYFQLWVSQMFLKRDRDWGRTLYPVVESLVTFRFGSPAHNLEFGQVAGPRHLRGVDPAHLDRVISLDHALTPLVPYSGGTVQVEAGLIATKADDLLMRFLTVMGSFSSLINVPQLSNVLNIAGTVTQGMEQLLGVTDKQMVLGFEQTFAEAAGGNQLRPGYIAVIDAQRGSFPQEQVWVRDGTLLAGATAAAAQPVTGVNYMLLRIDTAATRSDWFALATISEPLNQATNMLSQFDATGRPNFKGAEGFIYQSIAATWSSPDLTEEDRKRVALAIKTRFKDLKESFDLEAGDRGLEMPSLDTADVARLAGQIDSRDLAAVTLEELVGGL